MNAFTFDPELIPNNSPFPNSPVNDPTFAGFIGAGPREISEVPEGAGIISGDTSTVITPQGPMNDLMALRCQYPFLPIMPFPRASRTIVLTANIAQDVRIPAGSALMVIRGSADYYVTNQGNADVPTALTASQSGDSENTSKSIYAPNGTHFYVGGMNTISVVAANTGTIVTFMFWAPDQYPR